MNWLKRIFGTAASQTSSVSGDEKQNSRLMAFTSLLTPDDFSNTGIAGTNVPRTNMDDSNSAYMVYAGKSGATGGVELDVFFCEDDAADVFATVNAEIQNEVDTDISDLDGVEAVMYRASTVDGSGIYAGLNVKKDKLVFSLSIPDSTTAPTQLSGLALMVLERFETLQL